MRFDLATISELRAQLLTWYDRNRRDLPWRRTRDPYAIWVSEIMLQQTRVAAVIDHFFAFLKNFPTVKALAHADEQDVLAQWSGLGYYRRARMLHMAAKVVAEELDGRMPETSGGLRELPGIGVYTSAAIASIAFNEPVAVVDGNVERVIQRLAGWGTDSTVGQAELVRQTQQLATSLLDSTRPGDFNQSMMELGATVCLPKRPMCLVCPLRQFCATQGEHPTVKRAKMLSRDAGYALVIRNERTGRDRRRHREVLLEQRSADETVMAGMWELPALRETDVPAANLKMTVRHAIMQVNYYVRVRQVEESEIDAVTVPVDPSLVSRRQWVELRKLGTLPLTGLARKVLLRARLPELTINPEIEEAKALAEILVAN